MSRIVAERSSEAIGAGGVLSWTAAVYRRTWPGSARAGIIARLPTVLPELTVCAFPVSVPASLSAWRCFASRRPSPPRPNRPWRRSRTFPNVYFGITVADPYRYMEDLKNPEVADWMKAQADYTRATLDKIPQRDEILQEVTTYGDAAAARVSSVQIVGDNGLLPEAPRQTRTFPSCTSRHGFGGRRSDCSWTRTRLLRAGGQAFRHRLFPARRPDNKYVAYGISIGGSEQSVLHVIDVATGKGNRRRHRPRELCGALVHGCPTADCSTAACRRWRPERSSHRQVRRTRAPTSTRWARIRTTTLPVLGAGLAPADSDRAGRDSVRRQPDRLEVSWSA